MPPFTVVKRRRAGNNVKKSEPQLGLTINLISAGVAILIALALPLVYFLNSYAYEAAGLESEAALYANTISGAQFNWKSEKKAVAIEQLKNIFSQKPSTTAPELRRILDADNNLILEVGGGLDFPLITRSAALSNPDMPFARVEISRSLMPLVLNSAVIGGLAVLLGMASFVFFRALPLRAMALAQQEINTRRQTEGGLQKSLALLNATLEATGDGILVMDSFGGIVNFNSRFADMWRIPEEIVATGDHSKLLEVIAKQLTEPKRFFTRLRESKKLLAGSEEQREIFALTDRRWFEINSRPQKVDEEIIGRVLSFHDITERRMAETLLAGEKQVLEKIVTEEPLSDLLAMVARRIEEQSGLMLCAILTPDERGVMRYVATGGLPKDYLTAADALSPTVHAGTVFGIDAQRGADGISPDPVQQNALAPYHELAEHYGLRPGSGTPVYSSSGNLLGMVASYYRLLDAPAPHDERLLEIASNLVRLVIERKNAENRLEFLAHFDSLTGLPNRTLFRDRLAHGISRAERLNQSLALMFLDLDRFKTINDTLGHEMGDNLLKSVAKRLRNCIRGEDTVARLGGDEFIMILEQIATPEDAGKAAQKILDSFAPPFNLGGMEIFVTASIGISIYPEDCFDIEGLLRDADTALYGAKDAGRNTFKYYTAEMNKRSLESLNMENNLRHALERREFILYYQPKISLLTGNLIGAEALIRWRHPQRGIVPPAEFISLLEDTGMINEVGRWALQSACTQNKAWMDGGMPPFRIAVNISARQFLHNDLTKHVAEALEKSGLSPDQLELELTESLLMQEPEHADQLLRGIRALGVVRIHLDDFGTGYSSLSYLKRFPIDSVKIDASFVRDIPTDKEDDAIVLAVIAMAHSLGLKVIAEGVENEGQLEFLRLHECDVVQGYLVSPPLPADQFAEWARSRNV